MLSVQGHSKVLGVKGSTLKSCSRPKNGDHISNFPSDAPSRLDIQNVRSNEVSNEVGANGLREPRRRQSIPPWLAHDNGKVGKALQWIEVRNQEEAAMENDEGPSTEVNSMISDTSLEQIPSPCCSALLATDAQPPSHGSSSSSSSQIIDTITAEQLQSIAIVRAPPPAVSLIIGTIVQSVIIQPIITIQPTQIDSDSLSVATGFDTEVNRCDWSVCREQLRINSSELLRTLQTLQWHTLPKHTRRTLESLLDNRRLVDLESTFMQPLQSTEQYACVFKLWKWLQLISTMPKKPQCQKHREEEAPKVSSLATNGGFRMRNLRTNLVLYDTEKASDLDTRSEDDNEEDDDQSVDFYKFFGTKSECSSYDSTKGSRSDSSFYTATDDETSESVEILGMENLELYSLDLASPMFATRTPSLGSSAGPTSSALTPTSFFAFGAFGGPDQSQSARQEELDRVVAISESLKKTTTKQPNSVFSSLIRGKRSSQIYPS